MTAELRNDPRMELARGTLGPVRIIDNPNLPHRLLTLADVNGRTFIAKQHTDRRRFDREIRAHHRYLTTLRDTVPALIAHHAPTCTLLMAQLPGRTAATLAPGSVDESHAHYRAGAALKRLHDHAVDLPAALVGPDLADRLRGWTSRANRYGLLTEHQRRLLHREAQRLHVTPLAPAICHLDYQPSNWQVHEGSLWMLDFEHMRPDARIRDLARAWHRHWIDRPDLREAFLAGYAQPVSRSDQETLERFGAIEAITALVRGHETSDQALFAHGQQLLDRAA